MIPHQQGLGENLPLIVLGLSLFLGVALLSSPAAPAAPNSLLVLEDFRSKDEQGFPTGWNAQRNKTKAQLAYTIQAEEGVFFLTAKEAGQRVYKKIAWDPKAFPIISWKWRLKTAPADAADLLAAVYVSLDTDLFVIPVATKYVWSVEKPKGSLTEGGIFDASEIVLRTGPHPVGEWVEERVNAYQDFKRIHHHEPAEKSWGISLLAGPGVEMDFGPLAVSVP